MGGIGGVCPKKQQVHFIIAKAIHAYFTLRCFVMYIYIYFFWMYNLNEKLQNKSVNDVLNFYEIKAVRVTSLGKLPDVRSRPLSIHEYKVYMKTRCNS